ncbi:MAG: 50S ribosomal protein L17 [Bacteroidia bacterium]|nr:MAG: 50S ribosomal protein L17 [Bacteroidia bacterium]
MRHRNKINSLGRKAAHRKETMSSMATALILHKRINTTLAKAKALRVYVEPLITRSKEDSTHSRRMVFSYLKNKHAVSELFREVAQKVADRPGGYTRILKTGFRKGDGAEMCFIELVDYNTAMLDTAEETQQKRTRRGRRRGKKEETAPISKAAIKETPDETKVEKSPDPENEEQATAVEETTIAETPEVEETTIAETTEVEETDTKETKAEEPVEETEEAADEPTAVKDEVQEPETETKEVEAEEKITKAEAEGDEKPENEELKEEKETESGDDAEKDPESDKPADK